MESREYAYFCSTIQNSEHFAPLRNGSEQSSKSMFIFVPLYRFPSMFLLCGMVQNKITRVCLFLFNGTDFRAFFSSAECFDTKFREFFLLAALLLEGELYLEAGVAPHHEEEAGVDVLQVRLVAPRHANHLSEC
jgi:hypothetical protein